MLDIYYFGKQSAVQPAACKEAWQLKYRLYSIGYYSFFQVNQYRFVYKYFLHILVDLEFGCR